MVQQSTQLEAVHAVLLNGVFVVNACDQTLIGNVQQSQAWSFVDTAALGFNDAVFDLVAHAQAMPSADAVGFQDQFYGIAEFHAIECNGLAFLKAHRNLLALDLDFVFPERHTHDRVDDADAAVQEFQILGFVRGSQHIAVRAVGLLCTHLVAKACLGHEGRHFCTTAQFVDEQLVQPGLVNAQRRVGQQTVAVETLNVITFEGRPVTPNVDIVFLHGCYQHGAGDRAAQGGGVEVCQAASGDMERASLQSCDPLMGQLQAAIH